MLFAALITPLVRRLAHRYGAVDQGHSSRKIHGRPIPRLGGIGIVLGFYTPLVGLFVLRGGVGELFLAQQNLALGIFAGGLLIAALGVYDDLRGAGAGKKFVVQFAVAGLMYALGFRVEVLANPIGSAVQLGWFSLPFTMIWIVGVINALNLIDGLDGLAGGVALVAVSTIFLVSLHRGEPLMILFSAALAGAILGFLFYNFNPASIFMGDTGSMFLGFVLATSSIKTGQKSSTAIALFIPIIILGIPLLDTVLAIGRRALRGQPLFRADKEHLHHRLLSIGLSHKQAVLVLYAMSILLGGVALTITYAENGTTTLVLIAGLAVTMFLFLRRLGYIRFEINPYLSDQRRRNRALRAAVRPFGERVRQAANADELWEIVREAAPVFDATCVSLQLARTLGRERDVIVFSHGFPPGDERSSAIFRARFNLVGVKQDDGVVELGWQDGRSTVDRDVEIAIELFCDHVAGAYDRIRARPEQFLRAVS
jgi:UDP-GlcNAc:undecaprenyl-phosphate GlcNAc-1-phosphate transferase